MNKEELNLLLDTINNPVIGKALLTTFHKLNYSWLKLNDYGFKTDTEVYIRKENISYYGIV